MDKIITKLYEIIKESSDLIRTDELIQLYMYDLFAELVGDIFSHINQVIKNLTHTRRYLLLTREFPKMYSRKLKNAPVSQS